MANGWIKLHRKLLENPMFKRDKTAKFLFIDLLLLARKDGTFNTGRKQLAALSGNNEITAYKALKRLEGNNMVTLNSNNRFTTIYICGWNKYQGVGNNSDNNQVTTGEQLGNNKGTLTKNREYKNKRIENNTNVLAEAEKTETKINKSNPEINEMFDYWQFVVGYPISGKAQANRFACSNLLKKHGIEKLKQMVQGVELASQDQYAPRIADFTQLQTKFNELILWGKKQNISSETVVIR